MNCIWIATEKTFDAVADKFDRAVLSRGFAVFFIVLAAAVLGVGLAVNFGSYFGIALSPIFLLVLVGVAAAFWVNCFVLQDKRSAIQKWLLNKVSVHPSPSAIQKVPGHEVDIRSRTLPPAHKPPRSSPRAKS